MGITRSGVLSCWAQLPDFFRQTLPKITWLVNVCMGQFLYTHPCFMEQHMGFRGFLVLFFRLSPRLQVDHDIWWYIETCAYLLRSVCWIKEPIAKTRDHVFPYYVQHCPMCFYMFHSMDWCQGKSCPAWKPLLLTSNIEHSGFNFP